VLRIDKGKGEVRISEEIGGSRGTKYYYVEVNGLLEHITEYFEKFRRYMGSSRAGKRKEFEYRIPLNVLKKLGDIVKIYEFSFSNKGYGPYIRIFKIDCEKGEITEKDGSLSNINFKIDRSVESMIEVYKRYIPDMIKRVKDIQSKLKFELFFSGAVRLEDIYDDPENAWKTAIIYSENSQELYILMLVAEALNGKTVSKYGTPTWSIEKGQDYPTAIVEVNGRKFTIWYQFSIRRWIDVVFAGLMRLFGTSEVVKELQEWAANGEFEKFERLFGVRPKDAKEAYKLIREVGKLRGRQYVMPDIVVFEGEYEKREDIKENPPKRALIIEAKIEVGDSDIHQVLEYKRIFDQTLNCQNNYVVACLEKISSGHKKTLEKNGIIVVENVAPYKEGEEKLKEIIRKFFEL